MSQISTKEFDAEVEQYRTEKCAEVIEILPVVSRKLGEIAIAPNHNRLILNRGATEKYTINHAKRISLACAVAHDGVTPATPKITTGALRSRRNVFHFNHCIQVCTILPEI